MEEKTLYLPTEHNDRIVAFIGSPLGLLAAWLVLINTVTFLIFGVDKLLAKHPRFRQRVPEKNLLLLAVVGGSVGALLGLWFQSVFVGLCTQILSICIFLVIYGRMIEVYLVTSIGPIPFATMVNREWGNTGQNYLRSLLALGFQAFLIIVCVAIYAVLVQSIATESDIIMAIWSCVGYTVLLCFTLFKTGSLAKSVFNAH